MKVWDRVRAGGVVGREDKTDQGASHILLGDLDHRQRGPALPSCIMRSISVINFRVVPVLLPVLPLWARNQLVYLNSASASLVVLLLLLVTNTMVMTSCLNLFTLCV